MIREAESHADEAHKMREAADARNQAENLLYSTEKSLKDLRRARRGDDLHDRVADRGAPNGARRHRRRRESRRSPTRSWSPSHKLAQAVYEKVQSEQAASASSTNGESTSDDEVVEEADYEVIDEEAKQS